MKRKGSSFILLLIFLMLGIALAIQFKSTLYAKNQSASATLNMDKLKEQLAKEQKETENLKAAIDGDLKINEDFIKTYIEQKKDNTLAEYLIKAGLTDLKGPGISISLDDATARQPDTPVNWQIIHDQDIKIILNELKKSGAQAIAINGERIVPMSEQVCAGPTILINGNRYPVPYIIDAIGDPDILYENISKCERIAEMTDYKIRVEITKSRELVIPKFSSADNLDRLISGLEVISK